MNRKKKRVMTLLEMLIGLGLIAILLSMLGFFYRQITLLDKDSEKIQRENFQLRYTESRLAKILPNAIAEHEQSKDFLFFTSNDLLGLLSANNPSLVFLFDNGASADDQMANLVLARLFVDKENKLCLALWPAPKRWKEYAEPIKLKKEVLLDNVETLRFLFFVPPDRNRKLVEENVKAKNLQKLQLEPPVKGDWVTEWKRDYAFLPPMIKIEITRKGSKENLIYAFPLAHSQKLIVYEQ